MNRVITLILFLKLCLVRLMMYRGAYISSRMYTGHRSSSVRDVYGARNQGLGEGVCANQQTMSLNLGRH